MSTDPIRRIHLLGFIEEVRHIHENMPDRRFCFVLGAGASKSSRIPTAGELGLDWLRRIHVERGGQSSDFTKWLSEAGHGLTELPEKTTANDLAAIAAAYPAIYKAKWGHDRAQGHAEIERHIEAAKPSYGYYALAEILASDDPANPSRHNVVITPNFDNLPAETLGALGKKIPIVIGHSAIADFARPTLRRPLIIKFHHDFLLSPKSDPKDVARMEKKYSDALSEIFRIYTPIVIGYGGNDGSLMGLLEKLPERSIPGGILWCWRTGDQPGERVKKVVCKQAGTFVEISGFDKLLTLLEKSFGHVFEPEKLSKRAEDRAKELNEARERLRAEGENDLAPLATPSLPGEQNKSIAAAVAKTASEESSAVLDALSGSNAASTTKTSETKASPPWWHWQKRINATSDLAAKEQLYLQGLEATGNAASLLGNYALFLTNQRKDFNRAEEFYQKAVAADPSHSNNLGNYALFLTSQRKDFARADEFYQKAIGADPNHALHLGNYANFLKNKRKDFDRAEEFYQKAIAADPNNANNLGNYALFLEIQRKDFARAEELYQKAIAADPNHSNNLGNYAVFLSDQRKDFARAEEFYQKAIAADSNNANSLGNYAVFLKNKLKDFARAEEFYQKAIAADPSNSNNLGNYALFLTSQRKDFARADEFYQKAIGADPSQAHLLGNYANFLKNKRKDFDRAEEFYQKAIAADSNNANSLGNYALFLENQREDFARAEEFYKKAIAADPNNTNIQSNYSQFQIGRGRFVEAKPLAEKAWAILTSKRSMLTGEVAFSRWLIAAVSGKNGQPALGRLKTLLQTGYIRSPWSFDTMLEACQPKLSEELGNLARKLAAAILDETKLSDLETDPVWKSVQPIPLDEPWPTEQE